MRGVEKSCTLTIAQDYSQCIFLLCEPILKQVDNVIHEDFWYNYLIVQHHNEEVSMLRFAMGNVTCSFG